MHGRLKIKTTEEQKEAKRKEQAEKLKIYKSVISKLFEKRANNELDEEAQELSAQILQRNPELYTLWNYRKEIVQFMKPTKTDDELQQLGLREQELTEMGLMKNPKSYGAWEHRFWSMELQPNPDWNRELNLCNKFLSLDERNFHVWDYRRIVKAKCNTDPKEELKFTSELIAKNFSNYSAWHYRSKLLPIVYPGNKPGSVAEDLLLAEYNLVQNAAFTDPNDQSAWFYHRWLLGRGSEKFEIQNLSLVKQMNTAFALLSQPIRVCEEQLKLSMNDIDIKVSWKSADPKNYGSRLWYCQLPSDLILAEASFLKATITNGDEESSCSCKVNDHASLKFPAKTFGMELSDATKEVLGTELESCQQLYEFEPDSKWVLFTSVLLMRAIDSHKYDSTICKYLDQLMDIDKMRKHYYEDLKSKFVIENFITSVDAEFGEITLTGKNLTSLHHFEYFHFVKSVNLSNNKLDSLYPLCYLICVEELILDSNEIYDCDDIRDLLYLKQLSLRNNLIKSTSHMKSLGTCKRLQRLSILGNPVTDQENFSTNMKSLMGPIILDGQQL